MAKQRVMVQIEDNTKKWCQNKADELGISLSGLINIAIAQYRDQINVLNSLDSLKEVIKLTERNQKLSIQVPDDSEAIERQIRALEYQVQHDISDKDIQIHNAALKKLKDSLENSEK